MKCFTITEDGVKSHIATVSRESVKSGSHFEVIEVGEEGRGRSKEWIALSPTCRSVPIDPNNEKLFGITDVSIGKTRSDKYIVINPTKNDDRALVKLYYYEGFRGSNRYEIIEPGIIVIIAKGSHAQGAAGRMGGGEELLLIMEPNTQIICYRSGRTYGSPSKMGILWDGEKMVTFDPKEEPTDCDLVAVEEV